VFLWSIVPRKLWSHRSYFYDFATLASDDIRSTEQMKSLQAPTYQGMPALKVIERQETNAAAAAAAATATYTIPKEANHGVLHITF
jgi:hypothetical protein